MALRRWGRLWSTLVLVAPLLVLPPSASGGDRTGDVRALFFGDSLMKGTGARPLRPVMARIAARDLGWAVTVNAYGGTGFTTGGRTGRRYLDRLADPGVLSPSYDVVLLEGGTNDRAADERTVRTMAVRTIDHVRGRLPRARIILMGAFDPASHRSDPRRRQVDATLRAVAADRGVPFFSPLSGDWARGHEGRFLSADGLHPNDHGYGVMGARLAAELSRAWKP